MKYSENKPYPEVRVEAPNKEYAKILSQDYAGRVSEDSAVHLYLYQHLITEKDDDNFSEIMEKIAIVEMRHLEMLGRTIKLLGMNPMFKTYQTCENTEVPWTSEYVNYTTNYKKMLEVNIMAETNAIKSYKKHIELIDDKYIKQLLERIIEDEEIHLKIFYELYNEVKDGLRCFGDEE